MPTSTPSSRPPGEAAPPPELTGLPEVPGYEVEAVLGRGGMGIVYRARHLRLNRLVTLKMLLAGGYATPTGQARFQREAEAVAKLQHPNIVQVHDVGDNDERPYFTMAYVANGSLAHKLAGAPYTARQAAQMVATHGSPSAPAAPASSCQPRTKNCARRQPT